MAIITAESFTTSGDSLCNATKSYKTTLKLTGCNQEGEFTCNDGQCIKMERRCNQVPNCRDESDELNCQMLLLKNGYNKNLPPITANLSENEDSILPVPVNISITLMKVVEIEETDHSIRLQFQISLQWRENRVTYQNLKIDTTLNALSAHDIYEKIWLPLVV